MECFAWAYVTSLTRTRVNLIDLRRESRIDRSATPTSNPLTGLAAGAWICGSRVHRSRPFLRSALAGFLQFQSSCVARRSSASPIPKDQAPGSVRGYLTSPSPFVPKHKHFQWGHPPTPSPTAFGAANSAPSTFPGCRRSASFSGGSTGVGLRYRRSPSVFPSDSASGVCRILGRRSSLSASFPRCEQRVPAPAG